MNLDKLILFGSYPTISKQLDKIAIDNELMIKEYHKSEMKFLTHTDILVKGMTRYEQTLGYSRGGVVVLFEMLPEDFVRHFLAKNWIISPCFKTACEIMNLNYA